MRNFWGLLPFVAAKALPLLLLIPDQAIRHSLRYASFKQHLPSLVRFYF